MARSLLPPRGIFASTRLLFDRRLGGPLKETTLQLMALSWGSGEFRTPPLSTAQLAQLTGKSERTLRGHLKALQALGGVLTVTPVAPGIITVTLASWLFHKDRVSGPPCARLAQAPEAGAPAAAVGRRVRRAAAGGEAAPGPAGQPQTAPRVLTKKLQAELLERGLFPALLAEVAASPYSEADLRALLAWCGVDAPERPAGLFMGRLRAGARAPKVYHGAACRVCGQYGRHAPNCRMRYAQDIYNSG